MNGIYPEHEIMGEINSAIELLCMEYGECTPTQVLRMCKIPSGKYTLALVIAVCDRYEYNYVPSGRGYKIVDRIWDDTIREGSGK